MIHTTLRVSQNLFNLIVIEISARVKIPIQSLKNYILSRRTYFEPGSPMVKLIVINKCSTNYILKFKVPELHYRRIIRSRYKLM